MALICDASFAAPGEAEDSVTLPWKSLTDNIYATSDDPNGDIPQLRDITNTMNKFVLGICEDGRKEVVCGYVYLIDRCSWVAQFLTMIDYVVGL